jgi:hypothetical protein
MNEQIFDSLAQHAARGISRRASILTLGATGIATALSAPSIADAKKKMKCKKDTCSGFEEICAPLVEECIDTVAAICPPNTDCSRLSNCCEDFETCDVGAFVRCLATPA